MKLTVVNVRFPFEQSRKSSDLFFLDKFAFPLQVQFGGHRTTRNQRLCDHGEPSSAWTLTGEGWHRRSLLYLRHTIHK